MSRLLSLSLLLSGVFVGPVHTQCASAWCPGVVLPVPAEEMVDATYKGALAMKEGGACPMSVTTTCGFLMRYMRDPVPDAQSMFAVGSSLFCASQAAAPAAVRAAVIAEGLAAGVLEAFYVAVVDYGTTDILLIPFSELPACCLTPYGTTTPCGTQGNVASLSGYAPSITPGATVTLELTNPQVSQALSLILVSTQPGVTPTAAGYLHLASVDVSFSTGLVGAGPVQAPIPANPMLSGVTLFLQGVFIDTQLGAAEPKRLTNGLVLSIE